MEDAKYGGELTKKLHIFKYLLPPYFFGQSGAQENVGLRETKFGLATIPVVRSFAQRSLQILGIFSPGISDREICPRAKWRMRGYSNSRYAVDGTANQQ